MPGLGELSRQELVEFVVTQQARIQAQEQRIGDQDRQIDAQQRQIEELAAELARLRRLVSRNSGNSSTPPSKDDEVGRQPPTTPPRGRRSGRRPGKQQGSGGSALAWDADPAVVVDHHPEGDCSGCGADLAGALDEGTVRSCQVTDIPLVTASTTEHRLHRVRCGCGRSHTAPAPPGAGTARTRVYGPNLKAFTVYLLIRHALPIERAAELIGEVTGAHPSAGFVHGMLARTATALGEVTKVIKMLITLTYVAHFDETTLRCGPRGTKKHVWVACTGLYTAYHLGGRGLEDFRSFGVGAGFTGVAVHDRYGLYTHDATRAEDKKIFASGVRHQVCIAHLIRDLQDAVESLPAAHWPAQAQRALRELIHQANLARDAGKPQIPTGVREPLLREFRHAVKVGLSQIPRRQGAGEQPGFRALLEFLRDHEADVIPFVFDTQIPPTNNQAESDLRPNKTQQKISGRLRDETTTEDRLIIAGYLSTLRKHGAEVLAALRDAIIGNPWMPPGYAPT